MLQASRGMKISPIPKTAPFAEDEIEVLNRVVGPASATQRAWLAGFLAGLDAAHAAPQPAAPPQAAEPLTILYATESGNAERLASDVAKSARKLGFKPLLDGVEFAVLALGDTAYAEFCAIGKAIDARLAALGGKRAVDRIDCDLDFAEPAAGWIDATLHALAPPAGFAYQPGDSLDVYPQNDPAYVDELLQASGLAGDAALREKLIGSRDVTTLSLKTLQSFVAATNHADAKALLDSGNAASWIAGRQLIDLVEA